MADSLENLKTRVTSLIAKRDMLRQTLQDQLLPVKEASERLKTLGITCLSEADTVRNNLQNQFNSLKDELEMEVANLEGKLR